MPGMTQVGCKMPNGLHLELIERIDRKDSSGTMQLAGVSRKRFATLLGNSIDPKADNRPQLVGGYRYTQVDADKFAEWLKQNEGSSLLADRFIIHGAKAGDKGEAKELSEVKGMFARMTEADVKAFSGKKYDKDDDTAVAA